LVGIVLVGGTENRIKSDCQIRPSAPSTISKGLENRINSADHFGKEEDPALRDRVSKTELKRSQNRIKPEKQN